jgi:hypothetical protein
MTKIIMIMNNIMMKKKPMTRAIMNIIIIMRKRIRTRVIRNNIKRKNRTRVIMNNIMKRKRTLTKVITNVILTRNRT